MTGAEELFDLSGFSHRALFEGIEHVWEALSRLKNYIKENLRANVGPGDLVNLSETLVLYEGRILKEKAEVHLGDVNKGGLKVSVGGEMLDGASVVLAGATLLGRDIEIGKGTLVEPGALIKGPAIIGDFTEVRQGAYVRGNCIVGDRCVVGHTTEVKGSVMLNGAKAGHFAYIGDSILGNDVNLGAGTKLANLKIITQDITIRIEGRVHHTGLRKMGAVIGDRAELGCNSVTNPGVILGKGSMVYPCVSVPAGFYPEGTVISVKPKDILSIRVLTRRGP